ncbi:hypothetical protein MTR67_044179 [Solanum verrucosum]|uniref:RRM domain-containing protein n=1 Tax=Solanum verrucosum TaxID=315347 RepID=A0AAF0ZVU4_SOLVR|nr:hypothetical protein MTR67_044179 [Solanum verrucosum]
MSNSPTHSSNVVITNMSDYDSINILLRAIALVDNLQDPPSQNWRYPPYYSSSTINPFLVTRGGTSHRLQEDEVTMSPLEEYKLIRKDKSSSGFVDYFDHRSVALAIESLNGRQLFG